MPKDHDRRMGIKREIWGSGKAFVVIRDQGRIVSRRAWSKNYTVKVASQDFADRRTLKEGVAKRLTNFDIVERDRNIRKIPEVGAMANVTFIVHGRRKKPLVIAGSSMRFFNKSELEKRFKEAERNAFERLADKFNLGYDANNGRQFFKKNSSRIERHEKLIIYDPIKKD